MGLNRYILNRDQNIEDRIRKVVDRNYPDIAKVDRADVNQSLSSEGMIIDPYESKGSDPRLKIVWGTTRMGSKKVVTL
ncbi:MAG: hypothetical protein M0R32_07285 [Candidatus Cloacimonetes bacterium]|jgi:hypothetical protein|nr:hypothetical protein [Candidatus Cloacimonadota bacterium]